jgi:threonine aldolase
MAAGLTMRFLSDNTATACPEVLQALTDANHGHVKAYGDDPWTQRLDAVFSEYFGTSVRAFAVSTGTAANALSLSTLSPPYGAVYAHEEAHVVQDECGAVELFSGGARVTPIGGPLGKLTASALAQTLNATRTSVHSLQPASVSITQATEVGTVYRPEEIAALTELAHARDLKVHMDGARFANAVAFLNCHPGDVTWRAGVDVLSFGATKNGAIAAEAIVFFNKDCVKDFELRRKRAGHLISKSRYTSAQLIAYIESGVWLRNAQRANSLAQKIAQVAGSHLLYPVEANELFLKLGDEAIGKLRAAGFHFYDWAGVDSGEARLVVSWDQPEDSVTALCKALRTLI